MRLFLDANVLFSAARNPSGNCAALFALARRRKCALLSSRFAIEEAARNIALKCPEHLPELEHLVARVQITAEPASAAVAAAGRHGLPAKDAPILAAAIRGRAAVLVTGDRRHFDNLFGRRIQGVIVMSPADAVDRLLAT